MTIDWIKPSASELEQGILAKRAIVCYCSTDRGMIVVDYFGGYTDKETKKLIPRSPAVINYDRDMLIRRWQRGQELPPWVKFERRGILP